MIVNLNMKTVVCCLLLGVYNVKNKKDVLGLCVNRTSVERVCLKEMKYYMYSCYLFIYHYDHTFQAKSYIQLIFFFIG